MDKIQETGEMVMAKWHIYENSDEIVIAKKRRAQVMVCIPLNDCDTDYTDKDGNLVKYGRYMSLAKIVADALNKKGEV